MTFPTNDDFAKRELSADELDTISAGLMITFPFHGGHGPAVLPKTGVMSGGQGGDIDRPHPGEPTLSLF